MATKEELKKQAEQLFGIKVTCVKTTESAVLFYHEGSMQPIKIKKQ